MPGKSLKLIGLYQNYVMWREAIIFSHVCGYFLMTATDTERQGNIEGGSPSMLSSQPLSETLRSTALVCSLSNTI